MRILRRILLSLSVFILLLSLLEAVFVKSVHAQGTSELLPEGQTIDSDYIRAAQQIQIDGEIKGDAFLAGALVTVNGKVDGDLFVLGGKVNINGPVGNSIRISGGDVSLNGPVGRNVLLVCGNCSVNKNATISGSLLVTGGNLEVSAAQIGRGFRFLGNRLFLNSAISNEAFVVADQEFLLGPDASISGELKYTGSREVSLEPGATVGGHIAYQNSSSNENYPRFFGARQILSSYQKIKPFTDFLGFIITALVGFILLGLFPKAFEKVTQAIQNRPVASLGWGIIVTLMVPILVILFAVTIIGIPVSLLLLLASYLIFLAAKYLIAFYIGRKLLLSKYGERRGWALILGLFLIYLLGLIPIFGNLLKFFLMLFTLGAIVLAYKQPVIVREKQLPFGNKEIARNSKRRK